jgi:membrane protein DedA with SNARE-associated domain
METAFHWVAQHGYAGLFSLLMLGIFGVPVPDEGLLFFAGYLAHKGDLSFIPAVAAASLGSGCGITLSYVFGRTGAFSLIRKYGRFVHLTEENLAHVHNWFARVGRWALFFGYFVPGVRHVTALVAGTAKLEFPAFALFAYMGALVWSTTFLTFGYVAGKEWAPVSARLHGHLVVLTCVVVAGALIYFLRQYIARKKLQSSAKSIRE